MIMLTVTKPRRKLKRLLKGGALLLLLGVVVPGIYHGLQTVVAMSLFASGESVQTETGAPTEQSAPPEQAPGDSQSLNNEKNAAAAPDEQAGAVPTENVQNSGNAGSAGDAENSGNAESTESAGSAGTIEGTESAESTKSTESTINAGNTENAGSSESTESTESTEEEVDKPGLLERLKAVIFGEQATVQPY